MHCCLHHADAVVVEGYYDDPLDPANSYWLVRNSWSSYWGSKGYIKMAMMPDQTVGMCGMYQNIYAPSKLWKTVRSTCLVSACMYVHSSHV